MVNVGKYTSPMDPQGSKQIAEVSHSKRPESNLWKFGDSQNGNHSFLGAKS